MTQAFNLSQLANNLNSSGQLDATDGLVNAVPISNGGTGASTSSAARTNLNVPATDGTGATGTWGVNISGNAATASTSSACSGNSATATYATTAGNGGVTSVNGSTGAVTVNSVGVGQSWSDVTSSRVLGTTYTNSTAKPIMLSISLYTDTGHAVFWYVTVSGVIVGRSASDGAYGVPWTQISVVVPAGATYSATVSAGSNQDILWAELR